MENLANNFRRANEWQRRKRDRILKPFYGKHAYEGRYVFLDKGWFAELTQKRDAVDTILQKKNGAALAIEEKLVQWPGYEYKCFCLETDSCTIPGHEAKGWMYYGNADFLGYGFEQADGSIFLYLIEFGDLKKWFFEHSHKFTIFGPLDTFNASMGKLVPIADVRSAGLIKWSGKLAEPLTMTRRDPRRMSEMDLHMYVVELLTTAKAPGVVWRHYPGGEKRDKVTGAKLKKMGVLAGSFDFDLFIPGMRPCFLEVKSSVGRLSPEQKAFEAEMLTMGCGTGWARTPEQALALLTEWGAVRVSSGSIQARGIRTSPAEGA